MRNAVEDIGTMSVAHFYSPQIIKYAVVLFKWFTLGRGTEVQYPLHQ